jgi:hypothetical protein
MTGLTRHMTLGAACAARAGLLVAAFAALAGCAGDRLTANRPEPTTAGAPAPLPPKPPPPPVDMAGRWMLSAASGGSCAMSFAGAPGGNEGTIAPEGGCPGSFFTSRKWTFEQDTLIIRDHRSQPLARLAFSASNRFEGPATTGVAMSLTR